MKKLIVVLIMVLFFQSIYANNITNKILFNTKSAENIIYSQLKNYGSLHAYGFDHTNNQYKNMYLKHAMVGFYNIPYNDAMVKIAIAYSTPYKNYECHVCAPKISFFVFELENNIWILKKSYINSMSMGAWGNAPSKDDYSIVEIGLNKFGLRLDNAGGGQGYWEESTLIYIPQNGIIDKILHMQTGGNNSGTENKFKTDWESDIHIEKNNNLFYDIVLTKTGLIDGKNYYEKDIYKFDGLKYNKN